jgi:Ser-tRNA(Ala) deacylase AlaX
VKHRVPNTFEIGKEVEIEIDWKRRQDHMQQHSGQHLLSALATEHFNWDTVSWNLGFTFFFFSRLFSAI